MAEWRIGSPKDTGKLVRCMRCGGPVHLKQWVGFTPASGEWEHADERDCAKELERADYIDEGAGDRREAVR